MQKLLRITAATVMALGMGTGVASAHTGSFTATGPQSENRIERRTHVDWEVENDNEVHVENTNPQEAYTGDAEIRHNTSGGHALTGMATNDSLVRARVMLENTGHDAALAEDCLCEAAEAMDVEFDVTGPLSENIVDVETDVEVTVENENEVVIDNEVEQIAVTGDAIVEGNTLGGDAVTGDALNISTQEFVVEISN